MSILMLLVCVLFSHVFAPPVNAEDFLNIEFSFSRNGNTYKLVQFTDLVIDEFKIVAPSYLGVPAGNPMVGQKLLFLASLSHCGLDFEKDKWTTVFGVEVLSPQTKEPFLYAEYPKSAAIPTVKSNTFDDKQYAISSDACREHYITLIINICSLAKDKITDLCKDMSNDGQKAAALIYQTVFKPRFYILGTLEEDKIKFPIFRADDIIFSKQNSGTSLKSLNLADKVLKNCRPEPGKNVPP